MKKIISILIIIVLLLLGTTNVFAVDETTKNIELNLKGQTIINKETKTVELILSLGKFTGISENVVLGYQATLEYDTNMFKSVRVEGLNTWTATYEASTKVLVGELATATAKQNTDITKITLTLKDGVEPGTSGKVSLKNLELTDGTNDFTFNKDVIVKVDKEQDSENNTTDENKTNTNANTNTENKSNSTNTINTTNTSNTEKTQNKDNTTASKLIPKTGLSNFVMIAIVASVIALVIFKIKSREIKY